MGSIIREVLKSLLLLTTCSLTSLSFYVGNGNNFICFARSLWEINENNYVKQRIQDVYSEKTVCQFLREGRAATDGLSQVQSE